MKNLMLLLICLFMVVPSQARIITVDDDGPADFVAIQAAIDDSNDGDILVVGPGIYSKINFNGKNITVVSSNPDDPNIVAATIIDAGGTGSAVTFANGEGPDAVLTGFTITGGYGTVNAPFSDSIYWGGGIYCFGASPTIVGNIITNNEGPVVTGGVAGYGGGISCLESSATVMRNIIRDNSAYAGAGITTWAGSDRISSNLIYDNSASYGGGACMLYGSRLSNNTLVGNSASEYGGNIYAVSESEAGMCSVFNNIVSGALAGGGIFYTDNEPPSGVLAYNTLWNNAGGNYVDWPDQTGINGNISEDPVFVNVSVNNYHLQSSSGCINSGDPAFVAGPGETDIDGEARIYAVRVDIGADEYVGYINPVADAGDNQYLDAIGLVSLDGSGSFFYDPCGVRQFSWTQSGGPSVVLSDPCAEQPSFMPVLEDEYSFELVVGDGLNVSLPDTVLIVVGNRSPVADAGVDISCQVGEQVSLDGSGSYDPDPVDELTYSWSQLQGPSVVLYDSNMVRPYFDCSEAGTYEFELVVSDGLSLSEPDTVTVTALIGSEPDAYGYRWIDSDNPYGPQYNWIDIEGTGIRALAMSDDSYVGPFSMGFDFNFYGHVYSQFYVQSNGAITFGPGTISFGNNEIPSADGTDNMLAWMWDDLDGSGSTVYYQNFAGYTVVQFVDYNHLHGGSLNAEVIIYQSGRILFQYKDFTFDVPLGGCTIGIENADGTMGSQVIYNDPDYLHGELAIEFSLGPPYEPVADAGPDQYFDEIAFVTLDGTGSFDRDPCDVLTYYWSQVGGPSVVLSDPCVAGPTFIPDILGEYRFELVVSDGIFTSFPDDVVIAVGNRPPVAVAGPNSIYEVGTLVYLDGSGSYDPDPGDELTYFWRQLQGPNVVLEDANGPRPFFDANEEALYVFELVVSDGDLASLPDTVVVEAVILQLGRHGLLLYYKFDGSLGADLPDVITDDSGNNFQFTKYTGGAGSVTYGESNPIVAASTTSAAFFPNAGIYRLDPHPPELMDPLRLAGEQYTIELWMKPARHSSSTETATLIGRWGTAEEFDCDSWRIDIRDPSDDRELRWFHKGEDLGENEVLGEDEWYHVAAVYDQTAGGENLCILYLDGRLLDDQGKHVLNPADDNGPVGIGCDVSSNGTIGHFFDGLIDEVRIYDVALPPCQFQLTLVTDEYATCPNPQDGLRFTDPCSLFLSWREGERAQWHDVYFGTDSNEVADTDTASSVYKGRQELFDTFYFPPEPFEYGQTYYWRIDEVNDPNTWKGDVWSFTVYDPYASNPSPADGAKDVASDVELSWSPGFLATSHDVYLGTDRDDVNDADTTSSEVYKGRQNLDANSYDLLGLLELGRTHYWRIDEVNPGYADSKGDVWSFTCSCLMVDDMETYNDADNKIYDTWIDGWENDTGSVIGLGTAPDDPVHGGQQSMIFGYDNDYIFALYDYSEAYRTFADPCDWTVFGVKALTLYFYGYPGNDATEQMYVGLEDSREPVSYAEVKYGDNGEDMNDITEATWHEWNISLQDFNDAGVILTDVNRIYIGFGDRDNPVPGGSGTVYFDDVRLCLPRCIREFASAADFTGDCMVNLRDFSILGGQWLQAPGHPSADIAPQPLDNIVDWQDLAILADTWLQEMLWPQEE